MKNSIIRIILLSLLILDLGYSLNQYYHMPLGGDMGDHLAPKPGHGFYHVFEDPLGLGVLLENKSYPNPNRFFAFWTTKSYMRTMPIVLQKFKEPIGSIYLSVAIAKILIHILLIYLLSVYISNTRNPFSLNFLIAAALIFPLFQTWGYNRNMGIIDQSVIYAFFYALPVGLLLLFLLPFFRRIYHRNGIKLSFLSKVLLALFIPVLTLNGPLIPGIVLIACPLVIFGLFLQNYRNISPGEEGNKFLTSLKKIPGYVLLYFTGIIIFSLYSLYIGSNNSLTLDESIPLLVRYSKLPRGLYELFVTKPGFPLLFLMIIINLFLINRNFKNPETDRLISLIKWIVIFAVFYTLVLPFGGYRSYRPYILRYDTFIPVTLGIFFTFGSTALYLIKNLQGKKKKIYLGGIILVLLMITNADRIIKDGYICERQSLEQIAESNDSIVVLDTDCTVLNWGISSDPAHRDLDADLLLFWNVTKTKKLFYQQE